MGACNPQGDVTNTYVYCRLICDMMSIIAHHWYVYVYRLLLCTICIYLIECCNFTSCHQWFFNKGNLHALQSVQLAKYYSNIRTEEQPHPGMLRRIWNWFNTYYEEPVSNIFFYNSTGAIISSYLGCLWCLVCYVAGYISIIFSSQSLNLCLIT